MPELFGTLLPLTALHNQSKKGDLLETGKRFVDWLVKSGQNAWQVLPLNQTSWKNSNLFDSPYSSYGVGLNPLIVGESRVKNQEARVLQFREENRDWVEDYALFLALAEEFGSDNWVEWPEKVRDREKKEVDRWRKKLSERVDFFVGQQAYLHERYAELKNYANSKGVKILGDLPFYLDLRGPLAWKNQDLFEIGEEGKLEHVSGCFASEYFERQEWGHPLYRWDKKLKEIIDLFTIRIKYMGSLYDWTRIDHAIGFYLYGSMHPGDGSSDRLVKGPGENVFGEICEFVIRNNIKLFAEDLTDLDESSLQQTMTKYSIPDVSILPLALRGKQKKFDYKYFNPTLYKKTHFYYTSTHDTETLVGYIESLDGVRRRILAEELALPVVFDDGLLVDNILKKLYQECKFLILPIQEWLRSDERINVPGSYGEAAKNWTYQVRVELDELPTVLYD